jgi:hypothetical protein
VALKRWAAGCLCIAAAGIAGCGAAGGVDGPVLTSGRGGGGGNDAEVTGTVILEDECLVMQLEGNRYPVVWPSGTRWQPEPPAVLLASGTVPIGGEVSGGGGYYSPEDLQALPDEVTEAAAACVGPTRGGFQ